jgi:hypothetical protein
MRILIVGASGWPYADILWRLRGLAAGAPR